MRICVFEDDRVAQLDPLTLSRPAFDLRCGTGTLFQRQQRYFAGGQVVAWVRPHLSDICRLNHPGMVTNEPIRGRPAGPLVALVNARWLPLGIGVRMNEAPCVGIVQDEVAYAFVRTSEVEHLVPERLAAQLLAWKQVLPRRHVGGWIIAHPWDLIEANPTALEQDWHLENLEQERGDIPPGVLLIGASERVIIKPSARIEPLVLIDTTHGPVIIDENAVVQASSRLEGPCHIGAGTHVLGAKVRGGSVGPQCRIGGEVEASIVHGHSNKAHEGFLGHSYVGEWVNFGAGTQTSDLRNDYTPVRVSIQGQKVETGLLKVGSFVGDHTKTSLNALLNTGSVVGPFANLLASGSLLPAVLPAFSQFAHGEIRERAAIREVFATASTVMARRDRQWTETHAQLFLEVFEQTAALRQQAIQEAEKRRFRRVG